MSIPSAIRSRFVKVLFSGTMQSLRQSSSELWRKLRGRPHVVSVFLELDDPYSFLLVHFLPELADAYDIELHYFLAQSIDGEAYRPHQNLHAVYAQRDCRRLADEFGIPFLDKGRAPPVEHRRALIDALAIGAEAQGHAADLLESITAYWRGDAEAVARRISGAGITGAGDKLLSGNQQLLAKLGHYQCGMLHYGGAWYRGIDRLHYLTSRLDDLGLRNESMSVAKLASTRQALQVNLPVTAPNAAKALPPLELFYSFRSPYSYLSLQRTFAIADAYGIALLIRPVLPMVMRGLQVPRPKAVDFARDTSREARRLAIPFGRFADPLGAGAERCLAVFLLAQRQCAERAFLLSAGEAIWAQGIDVATDKGLRQVCERAGLSWEAVLAAISDGTWRDVVQENRDSMLDSGVWGVPTLRLGDFAVWGQDRIWLLVRHIEELCDTGDGILI